MKMKLLAFLLIFTHIAFGQVYGSKGLFTTPTSQSLPVGQLNLFSGMNLFGKPHETVSATETAKRNIWQGNVDFTLSYGIFENIDIALNLRAYQDSHFTDNNIPGNLIFTFAHGNIPLMNRELMMKVQIDILGGIAKYHNILYDDYFGEGLGGIGRVTFSYYLDQYLPNEALSLHATLGFKQFFDNGKDVTPFGITNTENKVYGNTTNTNAFMFSFGTTFPTSSLDFILEFDGYMYLSRPADYVIPRKDRAVGNLGLRYYSSDWVSFDAMMSLNIYESDEDVLNPANLSKRLLDGYSPWRFFLGINFSLRRQTEFADTKSEIERNEYKRKLQTFKGLLEEQDNADKIQSELERLREEREKAEKELEELKKILED